MVLLLGKLFSLSGEKKGSFALICFAENNRLRQQSITAHIPLYYHLFIIIVSCCSRPSVRFFIFSFPFFSSSSVFCCHRILLRLFAALTLLRSFFFCLFSWSHCCTQLAFMLTPDHFLLRFFAPTPNRMLFIRLMCYCRRTVSHHYHLAFYTHKRKHLPPNVPTDLAFSKELITEERIVKWWNRKQWYCHCYHRRTMHRDGRCGCEVWYRVDSGRVCTTDENDGLNLKSMFLALLNDVRLLQSAIFFCKTFRFTSIGVVVGVVVLPIWDYKYNNRFQ